MLANTFKLYQTKFINLFNKKFGTTVSRLIGYLNLRFLNLELVFKKSIHKIKINLKLREYLMGCSEFITNLDKIHDSL